VTRELAEAYLKIGTVQGDPVGSNLGDPAGAMQSYRRAESLLTGLRSRGDPATGKLLMRLYDRISVLQRSQSDPTGAVASTRRAREYARQVLARQPDDAETLTAAVEYDVSLSRALRAARDFPGAEQAAQSAIVSAEKLAAGPSGGAEARSNLADAISNLGVLQALRGDLDAAAASYRRLVEIRERMAVADPRNVVFQRQLMIAYGHVGDVLGFREGQHLGDFAGAAAVLEKAVTIAEWLTQQDPQDEKARFDLASAKLRLGAVLINLHQPANGRRQLEEAAALNAPLLRKSPANVLFQANSINLDQSLALAFAGEGRADAAVRLARQALAEAQAGIVPKITLPSQVVYADMTLAEVLARTGRLAEARKFAANVGAPLDAQPLLFRGGWLRAYFYSSLADVYRKTGDVRLAGEDLRRARDVWSGISGGPALSAFRQRELQRLDRELAGLK
jgi:tetratricopeptide (TPR) repeat protein